MDGSTARIGQQGGSTKLLGLVHVDEGDIDEAFRSQHVGYAGQGWRQVRKGKVMMLVNSGMAKISSCKSITAKNIFATLAEWGSDGESWEQQRPF